MIGATAGWIVTAPRLLMSIAEDKLFFTQFAKIHPKHKSPYISIMFQVLVVSALVIVGAGSYETLLHLLIPLILVVYSAVMLSVVILRFKKPELKRPYKVIFGRSGPILTTLFMVFLLVMFIRETHGALDLLRVSGGLVAFGIPAYFAIELFYDNKYVTLRRNLVAKLMHHFHKLPLPRTTFKKIISLTGPFTKKTKITVFNSPMASFTQGILKNNVKFKEVHIYNQSKEEIKFFKKKLTQKNVKSINIHLIRTIRIPNKSKKVDAFISFNDIGHVKDISQFVKDVKTILNKKGKFCFYIKSNFLNMAPNALLVESRKEINKIFKEQKLKMTYSKKKKFFKTEIFIYGKK